MKRSDKEKHAITLWVDKDLTDRIDKLAEKAGLTRSAISKNMLEVCCDQLEVMDTLGVLATALVFRNFKEGMVKWWGKESNIRAKKQTV